MDLDKLFDELVDQWKRRAHEARLHASKLSDYRHREARASYNLEASIYETCAKELEHRVQAGGEVSRD